MKRRALLGSMALAALPSMASAPQPKVLLTVSGRIGRINNEATDTFDFTEAEFLKLAYDQHHDRHTVDADLGLCRAPAARCHASRRRHVRQADLQDAR